MKEISIALISSFLLFLSCDPAAEDYANRIQKQRGEKDSVFRVPEESPLTPEDIKSFGGLNYFPVDPSFRVDARFERKPDPVPFEMPTTTERRPMYTHFATAYFEINGKELQLNVYQNQELIKKPEYAKHLFIPFRDLTCPEESYGGGRYLDVEIPEGNTLVIDFNLAYNPYCAYNHNYSCPIPPEENTLDVEIRAGEKRME